jgi:adenylate cyclase
VQCAVDAQTALAEANAGVAPDGRISFRIGVHIGDVMVRAGDLFGDGVNIAARLQSIAEPGGVCISGATYDQVRKILPITFTGLGAQHVKNIQEPIRAYQATALGEAKELSLARFGDTASPLQMPDKPSIVVLPFQNMSGDPQQEYFADGMVEEIITALSRFSRKCKAQGEPRVDGRPVAAGLNPFKGHLSQIERINKHVDHANRVALVNEIIEAFAQ